MKRFLLGFAILGIIGVAGANYASASEPYTVLHVFSGPDGQEPGGGVTVARDGTVYGTTLGGGSHTYFGTVFKTDASGQIVTLHSFDSTDGGGAKQGSPTLLDNTLYGSGASGGPISPYFGVLYSLRTDGSNYTILHAFNGDQGYFPIGNLQHIPGRGFVGVTAYGGIQYQSPEPGALHGHGVLFALTRAGRYRVLHKFAASPDGTYPNFVLTDGAGTIFGSAQGGGTCPTNSHGCGLIFKYDLTTEQYSIIYTFTGGQDGASPILGSIGADGTLYGATIGGSGVTKNGTLFALKPSAGGYALETLTDNAHALFQPQSGPTLTTRGLLIGTTQDGLYAYNLNTHKRELLQYLNTAATGNDSYSQPAIAGDGSILGTTGFGGEPLCSVDPRNGCGTLFRYTYTPGAIGAPAR